MRYREKDTNRVIDAVQVTEYMLEQFPEWARRWLLFGHDKEDCCFITPGLWMLHYNGQIDLKTDHIFQEAYDPIEKTDRPNLGETEGTPLRFTEHQDGVWRADRRSWKFRVFYNAARLTVWQIKYDDSVIVTGAEFRIDDGMRRCAEWATTNSQTLMGTETVVITAQKKELGDKPWCDIDPPMGSDCKETQL
jgi:hypothetical protein